MEIGSVFANVYDEIIAKLGSISPQIKTQIKMDLRRTRSLETGLELTDDETKNLS